jgi:hypothetical protein
VLRATRGEDFRQFKDKEGRNLWLKDAVYVEKVLCMEIM